MAVYTSKQELDAVITKMVADLRANEAFRGRIVYADVSVGFKVTDLGGDFALRLTKGQVGGGPGGADACSVCVSLTSATLDRLFSGQVDGETAYSTGALSLRGDEYTAQGILYYMRDIVAAYKGALA